MANNYLTTNNGVLTFSRENQKLNLSVVEFNLPDVSLPPIIVNTKFGDIKEASNNLIYSDLQISFIVDEDLSNWIELYNWCTSLGMPQSHNQYKSTAERFQDASMSILSSHNNPIASVKLVGISPTALSGITFSESDPGTVVTKATASFSVTYYEIEKK